MECAKCHKANRSILFPLNAGRMGNTSFLINNPCAKASEIIAGTLVLGMTHATGEMKDIEISQLIHTFLLYSWRS